MKNITVPNLEKFRFKMIIQNRKEKKWILKEYLLYLFRDFSKHTGVNSMCFCRNTCTYLPAMTPNHHYQGSSANLNWKTLGHWLEKAMAPHSSTLAWKIPWMEEPGRLQSMGSLRIRYDWATSLSLFTFLHWRRKWQPTPVFLPGEFQGRGSLVGCRLWSRTELDTTEAT